MPVFMYRKGEAKLFASPEDVPSGEGWQDTPPADMRVMDTGEIVFGDVVDVPPPLEIVSPVEPEPERSPASAELLDQLQQSIAAEDEAEAEQRQLDTLRTRAAELGVDVDGRWGIKKLTKIIANAEKGHGE